MEAMLALTDDTARQQIVGGIKVLVVLVGTIVFLIAFGLMCEFAAPPRRDWVALGIVFGAMLAAVWYAVLWLESV